MVQKSKKTRGDAAGGVKKALPMQTVIVEKPDSLLNFLFQLFADKSKTTVKSYLAHRQVAVNSKPITQFDHSLVEGDKVAVRFDKGFKKLSDSLLKVVYEDDYIIVINKSHGLLTVSTDQIKDKTAYRMVSDYVKNDNPRNRIFILHRLDKDTSGLLMFAKNQDIQAEMQRFWSDIVTDRRYVAVVEGLPEREEGEVSSYLSENTAYKVYSNNNDPDAKFALTRYRVLRTNRHYSLLELNLETGRKNQIRAHMEELGHSIAGDRKYGAQTNPIGRMALHAFKLNFIHPVTKVEMHFETPIPSKFQLLVKKPASKP